jgi:hypothetical protein
LDIGLGAIAGVGAMSLAERLLSQRRESTTNKAHASCPRLENLFQVEERARGCHVTREDASQKLSPQGCLRRRGGNDEHDEDESGGLDDNKDHRVGLDDWHL